MITIDHEEEITGKVKEKIKELPSGYQGIYKEAITPWLIRTVLECAETVIQEKE